MALQKATTTSHGFSAPSAYYRVEGVGIVGKARMNFTVCGYKDKASTSAFETQAFSCDYDLDGDNPIRQAYTFLKTLPDFLGAEDV